VNHPLTPNLTKLTDSELTKKINELNQRLVWAHTNLSHGSAVGQILMMLDDYKAEQQRRNIEKNEKIYKDQGKDWDSLIDV
tara:strand:+ start:2022 stop:2264 length:243 start_codon:yes stop_codon:yes gene_type:complete